MLNAVCDISHWNTVYDWVAVKESGIVGVVMKVTQGTSYIDPTYHERRQQALDVGLLVGAYHFAEAGEVSNQVDHFLSTTNPTTQDLLVLDWEEYPDSQMSRTEAEQFVIAMNNLTGRYPGLYSGMSFLTDQFSVPDDIGTVLSNCWLWLARYSSEPPEVPWPWETWSMWQYTDARSGPEPHEVPGIGPCDRDTWNGDLADLYRLWGVKPQPTL